MLDAAAKELRNLPQHAVAGLVRVWRCRDRVQTLESPYVFEGQETCVGNFIMRRLPQGWGGNASPLYPR